VESRIGIRFPAHQFKPQAAIFGDAAVQLRDDYRQGIALDLHIAG
jgi:hypothetical protein